MSRVCQGYHRDGNSFVKCADLAAKQMTIAKKGHVRVFWVCENYEGGLEDRLLGLQIRITPNQ